jgi:hypothetical protein
MVYLGKKSCLIGCIHPLNLSHDVMSILNMARVIIDYLIVNVKWEGMTI